MIEKMVEINFKYQDNNYLVNCSEADLIKDVCEKFAKENNLDLNDIYFVYKDEKINFHLGLFVQQQYDLKNNSENKDQKRMDIEIYETPFYIKFFYHETNSLLKIRLTDKLKDAFKKFADEKTINLSKVFFIYDTKNYFYDNICDERISDIITSIDKNEKVMSITVIDFDNDNDNDNISRTSSLVVKDINDNAEDDLKEKLIEKEIKKKKLTEKLYYIYNFIILMSQYIIISVLSFLGFYFEITKYILNFYSRIFSIIIQIIIIIFFGIFFLNTRLYDNKKRNYMIIFHIIYPFIVVYYNFIFSQLIDYNCIIIGLIFILIELLSMLFNICLKKFHLQFFVISSISSSLLALIIFSVLWIKALFPIIYISLFWLFTNAYYIFWHFISLKVCKYDEYFYSVIIFNYNIFLGLSYITANGIKYAFKNIKEIVSDEQKSFYLKNFIILLIQYLIIILVTFLGFYYDFNISFLNLVTHIISIILQLGIIIFFEINILSFLLENKGFAIIFNICFPFIASYYNFLLFSIIEYKYIIIGLSFILI